MQTLYLVRHGETLFNRRGMVQGWCDSPLTDRGREQAKKARDWLERHHVTFDFACTSPSERASDTLEIIAPGMDYARDRRLREFCYGVLEGCSYETVLPGTYASYGDYLVPFGGESEATVAARMHEALRDAMVGDVRSVLAVTHGACSRAFASLVCGRGDGTMRRGVDRVATNGAIYRYEYDGESFFLQELAEPSLM